MLMRFPKSDTQRIKNTIMSGETLWHKPNDEGKSLGQKKRIFLEILEKRVSLKPHKPPSHSLDSLSYVYQLGLGSFYTHRTSSLSLIFSLRVVSFE